MDKILILLPIKSNSIRLPKKSLKLLNGKAMFWYALTAAIKFQISKTVGNVIHGCSNPVHLYITTASDEIIDSVDRFRLFYSVLPVIRRPQYLAEDPYEIKDACIHALDYLEEEFKTLIMIQNTNPFVTAKDIEHCYDLFIKHDRKTVRSVTPVGKQVFRPASLYSEEFKDDALIYNKVKVITPYSTNSFVGNGSIVIIDVKRFLEENTLADIVTIPYVMTKEKSIDIDTEFDFFIAEQIIERNK